MVLRTHDGGPVELRRRAPWISLAASALVAAGCSAGPSGPTAVHRRSPASTGFTTTTASPERVDSPPTTTPADWYLVTAVGNSDDSVLPCVVFGSSFQSDLIVWNEGN